ncbi:hypothetical protein CLV63_1126 [Murinocardiopsis flavida]|uniref:Uncharacterized protein n=1 Tax=Murinocardiopsis flavida TaxID=645275 RepID=A0A2P8DFX3_9ACTN|nr:hypothetical protein [Murinocardiopsis flavida]PSK96124.1 hypothetical protein CLV63_1126 [Murinocardiopsis flavida]
MALLLRPRPRGDAKPRRRFGRYVQAAAPPPPPPSQGPAETAQALFAALRRAGAVRVYGAVHATVAVVSLPGATVWCRAGELSWTERGGAAVRLGSADIDRAVRLLLGAAGPSVA